jgi:UDP-N-acetylglucosamine--N-acetylmuramyl-(pentapeptide) pyrophosphoryl-undecaprenol N-acetylglucosamine transferase
VPSGFAGHFPADEIHVVRRRRSARRTRLPSLGTFWTLWRGMRQASEVDRRLKPDAVVGFGGYPTVPPLYAATRRSACRR